MTCASDFHTSVTEKDPALFLLPCFICMACKQQHRGKTVAVLGLKAHAVNAKIPCSAPTKMFLGAGLRKTFAKDPEVNSGRDGPRT